MDDTKVGTLAGRAVEIRTVGCGVAMDANTVMRETNDHMRAACVILAEAAYWEDTGQKVFADVAAVRAWPMPDLTDINALALLAQEVNTRRAPTATTNGTGEPVAHPT